VDGTLLQQKGVNASTNTGKDAPSGWINSKDNFDIRGGDLTVFTGVFLPIGCYIGFDFRAPGNGAFYPCVLYPHN